MHGRTRSQTAWPSAPQLIPSHINAPPHKVESPSLLYAFGKSWADFCRRVFRSAIDVLMNSNICAPMMRRICRINVLSYYNLESIVQLNKTIHSCVFVAKSGLNTNSMHMSNSWTPCDVARWDVCVYETMLFVYAYESSNTSAQNYPYSENKQKRTHVNIDSNSLSRVTTSMRNAKPVSRCWTADRHECWQTTESVSIVLCSMCVHVCMWRCFCCWCCCYCISTLCSYWKGVIWDLGRVVGWLCAFVCIRNCSRNWFSVRMLVRVYSCGTM